jgi:hypothetical protein
MPRPATSPSFPVTSPPLPAAAASRPPLAIHVPAAVVEPIVLPAPDDAVPPAGAGLAPLDVRVRQVNRAALLIAAFGIVIFAAVGYFAFPRLIARQLEHDEAARRLEKLFDASRQADAPDAAKTPQSSEPPPTAAPANPTTRPPAPKSVAPAAVAPAAAPPDAPPAAAAEASTNFRAWTQNVRITGLRTGAHPRILINNVSFDVGEIVHAELGIVFDGYDSERRVLRFKDATGAVVERRHP